MITEAEKSRRMLTASWRTRKAGDVIQCDFEGPVSTGADGITICLRPKAGDLGALLMQVLVSEGQTT
jgi:hypothetical protein